ncbi:MAG: hemerythrin family protein [Betaproteobacteria bacterium]|nr:hemerythrin family protein [Betaproteobacteria bacterium]
MDAKYILGIPEIDAQHEELHELVNSLREVITRKDQRHLVHQALKRLHQLLVTHFAYEEAFMKMIGYADLPQHKKTHKGVLNIFENYFDHPPEPGDYEILGKMITDKVLGHVMEHDVKMTEVAKAHMKTNSAPRGRKQKT